MRSALILAFLSVLVAACGGETAAERAFFDRAKGLKQAGHMKLADAVSGDWTSVCFHGGYAEVPEFGIDNDESDWTLVFYREKVETARVQGNYRKLVLNSPHVSDARDCHGRDAVIAWEGERALFRAGAR